MKAIGLAVVVAAWAARALAVEADVSKLADAALEIEDAKAYPAFPSALDDLFQHLTVPGVHHMPVPAMHPLRLASDPDHPAAALMRSAKVRCHRRFAFPRRSRCARKALPRRSRCVRKVFLRRIRCAQNQKGPKLPKLQCSSVQLPEGLDVGMVSWFRSESAGEVWPSVVGGFVGTVVSGRVEVKLGTVLGKGGKRDVLKYLEGSTSSKFSFGEILPVAFTLCSVSRYTGGAMQRILQGSTGNFLHGHWNGEVGVANYDKWVTPQTGSKGTQWAVMCGTNADALVMFNGKNRATDISPGGGLRALTINHGGVCGFEQSHWAVLEVMSWNRPLSRREMKAASKYLMRKVRGRKSKCKKDKKGKKGCNKGSTKAIMPTRRPLLIRHVLHRPACQRSVHRCQRCPRMVTMLRRFRCRRRPFVRLSPCIKQGIVSWFKSEDAGPHWPSRVGSFVGHVVYGTVEVSMAPGLGGRRPLRFLQGSSNSHYSFGHIVPEQFTICSISRYTGRNMRRILQGSRGNFLHGHWEGQVGVAYYNKWVTPETGHRGHAWSVMCGTNMDALFLLNGVNRGTATAPSAGSQCININHGGICGNERSDWAIMELMTWRRALPQAQMMAVSAYLHDKIHQRWSPPVASAAHATHVAQAAAVTYMAPSQDCTQGAWGLPPAAITREAALAAADTAAQANSAWKVADRDLRHLIRLEAHFPGLQWYSEARRQAEQRAALAVRSKEAAAVRAKCLWQLLPPEPML